MGYKIIASDLDGTLINRAHVISEQNKAAIKELYDMGIHFVPSSGRSFDEMPEFIRTNPYIRYYITSSGATVYDKKTDTVHELALTDEQSKTVLDKLYEYPINMMLHADRGSYVDAELTSEADYRRCNYSDSWIEFVRQTNVPVKDFKRFAYSKKNIHMFCVFFENYEDIFRCKEYFDRDDTLITAQSNKYNLEVTSATAGKGNALYLLADLLGIDRAKTIAVGDSTNDYTMVKQAGLGLAMENAVDELKAVADAVICDNDSHAIKYIVERYIK